MNRRPDYLKPQLRRNLSNGFLYDLCEQYLEVTPPLAGRRSRADSSARTSRLCTRTAASMEPIRYLFPDVDVWLALSVPNHKDHARCHRWLRNLALNVRLCFCSVTQVGLLKRLTTGPAVVGEKVLHHDEAWDIRDV
jgi:hypothetical protein